MHIEIKLDTPEEGMSGDQIVDLVNYVMIHVEGERPIKDMLKKNQVGDHKSSVMWTRGEEEYTSEPGQQYTVKYEVKISGLVQH